MFYERLIEICKNKSISVTALLKDLNISTSKGTAWKNGSTPNSNIAQKIADYFNVSTDYLLGRTDNPSPSGEVFALYSDIPYDQLPPEALEELENMKQYILEKYKKKTDK